MDLIDKNRIIVEAFGFGPEKGSDFLLQIIDNLVVGILIMNIDETVLYVNKRYTEITGVKYENIVNRKLLDVRPNAQLGMVVKQGKEKLNLPRSEDGKKYFVDLAPIRINGKIIGGITIMKDFEDGKKISEQIKNFEYIIKRMEKINDNVGAKYTFDQIIYSSTIMREIIDLCKKASLSDSNILITGETGTGKELIAQSIHNYSNRRKKPFMPINCGTIPNSLIESELFGYVSGAFTDSAKKGKIGLFELASGGTIFLDEIENMPLDLQVKLLRVIQEKKVRKVGATSFTDVDVRIISATNINLSELVNKKLFREDLFYRINSFPITLPNLNERNGDIEILIKYFVDKYNKRYNTDIKIDSNIYKYMNVHIWTGNVRELENIVDYLCIIDEDGIITVDDLPNKYKNELLDSDNLSNLTLKELTKKYEKDIILQYLKKYGKTTENKKAISNKLGISLASFYKKCNEFEI